MTIIHDGTAAECCPGVNGETVPGRNPHYLAADTAAGLSGMLSGVQSPAALVVDDCNDVAGPDVLADLAQVVRASGGQIRLVLA